MHLESLFFLKFSNVRFFQFKAKKAELDEQKAQLDGKYDEYEKKLDELKKTVQEAFKTNVSLPEKSLCLDEFKSSIVIFIVIFRIPKNTHLLWIFPTTFSGFFTFTRPYDKSYEI